MHYYDIAALKKNKGIFFSQNNITAHLDQIEKRITSDEQLLSALHPDTYFFLSGGGTILINNRYLLMVQRHMEAHINAGKWSFFTGRAEGPVEWREPWLVARELFEELALFSDGKPLYPLCPRFQNVIDSTYKQQYPQTVNLHEIAMHNNHITVMDAQKIICDLPAYSFITPRNDINLLFLFAAELDIAALSAKDNEHARNVALLDLKENRFALILDGTEKRSWKTAENLPMTELMENMLQRIKAL